MAKRGIDISAHQGDIDLSKLKGQIDFVIIRVGYGTKGTIDTKFTRNANLCRDLGIPVGFYWYSYALDIEGAKKEAQAMINAIDLRQEQYGQLQSNLLEYVRNIEDKSLQNLKYMLRK